MAVSWAPVISHFISVREELCRSIVYFECCFASLKYYYSSSSKTPSLRAQFFYWAWQSERSWILSPIKNGGKDYLQPSLVIHHPTHLE